MGLGCGIDVFLVLNQFIAVGFAHESCDGLLFDCTCLCLSLPATLVSPLDCACAVSERHFDRAWLRRRRFLCLDLVYCRWFRPMSCGGLLFGCTHLCLSLPATLCFTA